MVRIIWNRRGNPPKYVSDHLGIEHWQLGDAIHEIKAAGNLRATEMLSYMITGRSGMTMAMPSATSMTSSENAISAYRKGGRYWPGPRSPEITGKTGVWYFSTKRKIPSKDLTDHLNALVRRIFPF